MHVGADEFVVAALSGDEVEFLLRLVEPQADALLVQKPEIAADRRIDEAQLVELRWGLIPSWAKDESIGARMINARAETLAEKASFKGLLRSKRCMIIADGFFEWKQENGHGYPVYLTVTPVNMTAVGEF